MTREEAMLEAQYRAEVLDAFDAATALGWPRFVASTFVAAHYGIHHRTIWRWLELCDGFDWRDRLKALAPTRRPKVLNLCEACALPGSARYQSGRTAMIAQHNQHRAFSEIYPDTGGDA